MFVDQVDIQVSAGDGGNGCVSFRREKFVPRGGPDGGDGGRGGSVHLRATSHQNTLVNFKFHPLFRADRGDHGQGSNRSGRAGKDLVLQVPLGTVVYRKQDEAVIEIADLAEDDRDVLVAKGGRGGRGNAQFATSVNRAPRWAESGVPGQEQHLRLSLKLLADIGLVGYPNVGKSTLISRLSAARPKIADYPFTTLTPHLGVVQLDEDRSFVLADVPGLIEGAHAGQGLGHRFLSHLERTKVLVYVVDLSSETGRNPVHEFETVCRELASFPVDTTGTTKFGTLLSKPRLVAANKVDALDEPARLERLRGWLNARDIKLYPISAVTGEGLDRLREAMWLTLAKSAENSSQKRGQVLNK